MVFWFSTVIGTWLLLSVVVSLGMARAISLSNRTVYTVPAQNRRAQVAYPSIPLQTRRTDVRVLTSMNRRSA